MSNKQDQQQQTSRIAWVTTVCTWEGSDAFTPGMGEPRQVPVRSQGDRGVGDNQSQEFAVDGAEWKVLDR